MLRDVIIGERPHDSSVGPASLHVSGKTNSFIHKHFWLTVNFPAIAPVTPICPPAARTFACAAFTLALRISVGARRTCWACEYIHVVEIPGLLTISLSPQRAGVPN